MKKYGLVGKKLTYSYSKIIHDFLIDHFNVAASYDLLEVDEITADLLLGYAGLNVTIPYKEVVLPFLSENFSPILAVNTLVCADGLLSGFNTDIIGFDLLVAKLGITNIKRVVILGQGASSMMVAKYFAGLEVITISRSNKTSNYETLKHLQGDIIVNTTPIGMETFASIIDESIISNFVGVIDINYNPLNSKLALLTKGLNKPFINGLYMLIMQAVKSFEIWHKLVVELDVVEQIYAHVLFKTTTKIALVGMPLSGKTTAITRYNGVDLDAQIILDTGMPIELLLAEKRFRAEETKTLMQLTAKGTPLIALGGGAILKNENIELLKDYLIVFLDIPLDVLIERSKQEYRPLIKSEADVVKLYNQRIDLYRKHANISLNFEQLEAYLK
ncbi:MAG: shikimate kinase [Culicoidibacterales bacterium]